MNHALLKKLISALKMFVVTTAFWVLYGIIVVLFFTIISEIGAGFYYGIKYSPNLKFYLSVSRHGAIMGLFAGTIITIRNLLPDTIDKRFSAWVDKRYGPIDDDGDKSEKNGNDK